jgi:hypothetical protein
MPWLSKTGKGTYSEVWHDSHRCCQIRRSKRPREKRQEVMALMGKRQCAHCSSGGCGRCSA